jgi:hypothetical protein
MIISPLIVVKYSITLKSVFSYIEIELIFWPIMVKFEE